MSQTVGQFLRQTREERKISLEQVAQATRVRLPYLVAIENDDQEEMPSPVQARGFLRLYASFLELPAQPLLDGWKSGQYSPEAQVDPIHEPVEEQLATSSEPAAVSQIVLPPTPVESIPPVIKPLAAEDQQPASGSSAQIRPVSEPSDWQNLFSDIGDTLRERRESLHLSIEDIERFTRLRAIYIESLEEARFEELPSFVQGRGMLSNYAEFLDLDTEDLMLKYADALQSRRQDISARRPSANEKRPSTPARIAGTDRGTGWRRFLTLDMVLGGGLFIVLIGFVLWGAFRVINLQRQEAAPTLESISDILMTPNPGLVTPTPDLTSSPTPRQAVANTQPPVEAAVESTAQPTELVVPTLGNSPVSVYIVATQRAWMRVTVDTTIAFEGRTIPGVAYPFTARESVRLLTGNAAALQVVYNENNLGSLGTTGEVVDITFTRDGTVVPTAVPTETPTPTQTPTMTLQPTVSKITPSVTPYVP